MGNLNKKTSESKTKTSSNQKSSKNIMSKGRKSKSAKQINPKVNIRRRRNKKSFPVVPVAIFTILLAVGIYFAMTYEKPPEIVQVVKVKEKPKPKKVIPKKKEVVKAKVIAPVIKKKPVVVKADLSVEVQHKTFGQIFDERCIDCHGREGNKIEGKVNLVKLLNSPVMNQKYWNAVYKQVEKGEMPPEDEEALTADEKETLLSEIRRITSSTEISRSTRPLTPDEIKNTLVDLFNIDQDVYNPFTPLYANYSQHSFYSMQKNVLTPFYLDDLYETLYDSLESYVALNPVVEPLNLKVTAPKKIHLSENFKGRSELRWGRGEPSWVNFNFKNRDAVKKVLSKREQVGPQSNDEELLEKLTIPPGTYKLSFDAQAINMDLKKVNQKKYGSAVYEKFKSVMSRHEYSLPIKILQVPPGQADPHARIKPIKTIEIQSSEMSRYTIEFTVNRRTALAFRFPLEMKMIGDHAHASMISKHKFGNSERKNLEWVYKNILTKEKYDFPMVRVINPRLLGPYNVKVSDYSVAANEKMDNLNIRKKFRTLHEKNFIQNNIPYDYIFSKFAQRGIDKEVSYRTALVSFFMSPDFLTLEYNKKDKRKHARMLAYTFHKTRPDKEFSDKLAGSLKSKDITGFSNWLISHENFKRYVDNFTQQWLEMDSVKGAMPEEEKFYDFYRNDRLESYKKEINLFINHLFVENRPVHELITANYSFLNSDLASFYDRGNVKGDGFHKYNFTGKDRGGLLSSGAFLLATGNGVDPLPIKRAKWILEKVLDYHLPPPPENIDLDEFQQDLSKPLHEKLKAHSQNAACFNCHKKIDPLAIVMNKFDTAGGMNSKYRNIKIEINSELIKDFAGFKKYIGGQEETIARSFVKNILRYSLGRDVYVQDNILIDKMIKENKENQYPVKDLLNSIIKYYFFENSL